MQNPEVAYVSTTDGSPGYWVVDLQGHYATQEEAEAEAEAQIVERGL
jgi:hypothetical protein